MRATRATHAHASRHELGLATLGQGARVLGGAGETKGTTRAGLLKCELQLGAKLTQVRVVDDQPLARARGLDAEQRRASGGAALLGDVLTREPAGLLGQRPHQAAMGLIAHGDLQLAVHLLALVRTPQAGRDAHGPIAVDLAQDRLEVGIGARIHRPGTDGILHGIALARVELRRLSHHHHPGSHRALEIADDTTQREPGLERTTAGRVEVGHDLHRCVDRTEGRGGHRVRAGARTRGGSDEQRGCDEQWAHRHNGTLCAMETVIYR